ncbi:MAG: hypothetical protein CVT99_16105 [Bacteroidetes bacterium HGW-Bacteroidetes-16]|jgi:hypothetical protein|nr:MAG: hypothetical protein CVT99_16105 [Bacteroidetes bacterium HGW-Bacteroidetes-16]
MNRKKKNIAIKTSKKSEMQKYGMETEDEDERFINRLAIQRKLLSNFIDPESLPYKQNPLDEEENDIP